MNLIKAHAFGNDFLLASEDQLPRQADREAVAK